MRLRNRVRRAEYNAATGKKLERRTTEGRRDSNRSLHDYCHVGRRTGSRHVAGKQLSRKAAQPQQQVVTSFDGEKRSITLQRGRYGQYLVSGTINGAEADFLVDTGASSVSIPVDIADSAGLTRGAPISISTANGIGTAYRTKIDYLKIGDLEIRNATAHINPGLSDEVLLGMSILKNYELVQRGDQLVIREP